MRTGGTGEKNASGPTDRSACRQTDSRPQMVTRSRGMNERSKGMNEQTAGPRRDHGESARRRGCCFPPPVRASRAIFKPGKGSDAQADLPGPGRVKRKAGGAKAEPCGCLGKVGREVGKGRSLVAMSSGTGSHEGWDRTSRVGTAKRHRCVPIWLASALHPRCGVWDKDRGSH